MEFAKQHAFDILTALGCEVDDIPTSSNGRRADLRATVDSASYVVEVRQKNDNFDLLAEHSDRMAAGEVVSRSESTGYNNRFAAILKDKNDQILQTPSDPNEFRIVWMYVNGIDKDLHWKRAFATFYGFVQLIALDPPNDSVTDCFYFDFSAARSLPTIDAMILTDGDDLQLCLNEYSHHLLEFVKSPLPKHFANGIVDPIALAKSDSIIALRSDISRKNEDAVLNALFEQTGTRYTTLRPEQHSASAMVGR